MSASIEIRPGTPEDIEAVLLLERSVSEAPHWSRFEYESIFQPNEGQGGIQRRLWIAETRVPHSWSLRRLSPRMSGIGFAVAKVIPSAELAELESIVVSPAMRRQGVGTRLCQASIEWCRARGAVSVELEVRSSSHAAIRLYWSLGFFTQGVRRAYYRDPEEDAALMRLNVKQRN
ncbi:MAG: GNAT family N-acetyltransferase [Acidobacteriaceae bacterium]|nr:GNAT family N-acetyltransferase [Acidobacteriaceae bacterium]